MKRQIREQMKRELREHRVPPHINEMRTTSANDASSQEERDLNTKVRISEVWLVEPSQVGEGSWRPGESLIKLLASRPTTRVTKDAGSRVNLDHGVDLAL
jgi:hypothetical protein